MSKREYLEWIIETALRDDYNKEEATRDLYSKYQANPKSFTEKQITDYLGEYLKKDRIQPVVDSLKEAEFWDAQAEDNQKLIYLKWKIVIALGEKYNNKKFMKEVYNKYMEDRSSYGPDKLIAFLKEFMSKETIDKLLNDLEEKNFFVEYCTNELDPLTYLSEQTTLSNYEEDYKAIPEPRNEKHEILTSSAISRTKEPTEKILYRCLIMAFLYENEEGTIKTNLEEFIKHPTLEEIKSEVAWLKKAIQEEGRSTSKIARPLEQIINFKVEVKVEKNAQSIYDNLCAIKRELVQLDISDLSRLVQKTTEVEGEIEAKSIVLFLGETGSGKTTTIKALLGYKMGLRKFKGMNWVTIVEEVTDKKVLEMHANPSCKSVTRYLVAVKPMKSITVKDIYLADTPGWGDTAGLEVQLANILGVKRALKRCKSVIPVLIISKESWGTRGAGIRNLGRTVTSLFQDFDAIKESIVIVMNRFSSQEIKEMEHKFQNLLDEMDNSDRANLHYLSFLEHLRQLAAEEHLLTFDPLQDDPKKLMQSVFKMKALTKPNSIFQDSVPSTIAIKSSCEQISKRIGFHLKANNSAMVYYFYNNLETLNNMLKLEAVENEISSIRTKIKEYMQRNFEKIVEEFRFRIRTFNVSKEDIKAFFANARSMTEGNAYDKILENFDLLKESQKTYQTIVKDLASAFMTDRSKEEAEDSRNKKKLEVIKILYKEREDDEAVAEQWKNIKKWLDEKIVLSENCHFDALEKADYEAAAQSLEIANQYAAYKPTLELSSSGSPSKINSISIKRAVPDHAYRLFEEGKTHIERRNIDRIVEIDQQINKLNNCYRLMACLDKEIVNQTRKYLEDFTNTLKTTNSKDFDTIVDILNKAKVRSVDKMSVDRFQGCWNRMREFAKIKSMKSTIQSHLEQVKNYLRNYIEGQRLVLEKVNLINKSPKQLKDNIEDVQTALNGVEYLAKFGGKDLEAAAADHIKIILVQLNTSLPKMLDKLRGGNELKFNMDYEEIFQKICDAYNLEGVFKELANFQSEYKKLQIINGENQKIVKLTLERALECIKTLQPKKEETTDKEPDTRYTNIILSTIELATKFIEHMSRECPFEGSKKTANDYLEIVATLLQDFRAYCFLSVRSFGKKITQAEEYIPKQLLTADLKESCYIRDEVGDNCREIWRWAKRVYQQVNDIGTKYPTIRSVGGFQVDQIIEEFRDQVVNIYHDIVQIWNKTKATANKFEEVNILVRKCETFRETDKGIIPGIAEDFINLRKEIREKIATIDDKLVSRIDTLLDARSFVVLRTHIQKIKSEHGKDSIILDDANRKMEDFAMKFLKEKKKELDRIRIGNLEVTEIPNYAQTQEQLNDFLSCYQHEGLRKLKEGFEDNLNRLMPKVLDELENHLATRNIGDAFRSLNQLDAIERNLTKKQGEVGSNKTQQYKLKIASLILKIQDEIAQWSDPGRLNKFFERNLHAISIKQIAHLKSQWDEKVANKFAETISFMEKAERRSDINSAKTTAEQICSYFPQSLREQKKTDADKSYKRIMDDIQAKESRLRTMISQLEKGRKLDFDTIRVQLEYMEKEPNEMMMQEIVKAIKATWELQKKDFLEGAQRSIQQITQFFIMDVQPFLIEAEKYKGLIGGECTKIEDSCFAVTVKQTNYLSTKIMDQLQSKGLTTVSEVKAVSDLLLQDLNILFKAVVVAQKDKRISLKDYLSDIYEKLVKATIGQYEKAFREIKIKEMFEEKIDSLALAKFEIIVRVGPVIETIQQQFRSNSLPAKNGGDDEMAVYNANVESLPKSGTIINEFTKKLEEILNGIDNFDVLNDKHDSSDQREMETLFREFERSVSFAKAYIQTYRLVGGIRPDSEEAEKKLKNDIELIRKSSLDMVNQKLFKEQEDKMIRKLNHNTLLLRSYEKVFTKQPKQGQLIRELIAEKIKVYGIGCEESLNKCYHGLKDCQSKQKSLQSQESSEITQQQDAAKAHYGKQMQDIQHGLDSQMNALKSQTKPGDSKNQAGQEITKLRKRKESQLDSKKKELQAKLSEIEMAVKAKYQEKSPILEKEYLHQFKILSQELPRIKQIEVGLAVSKQQCSMQLDRLFKTISTFGTKFANLLASCLEQVGTSYAILLLTENPKVFRNYNVRKFKEMVVNIGYEEVINKIPDLGQAVRNDLKEKYSKFRVLYDAYVKDFNKTPTQQFQEKLKDSIKKRAFDATKEYQKNDSVNGYDILAQILAFWTIIKAECTQQQGVEYLYEPHPAQVIAIFLILGICGSDKSELSSRIAQVLTGQGKSLILGTLSCYLALTGFDVYCMCYSKLLSRRDFEDFLQMFQRLDITQYVYYGTFEEVTQRIYNPKKRELREDIQAILLKDEDRSDGFFKKIMDTFSVPRKQILLIDEVDVFFNKDFFGQRYTPSIEIKHECIENLAIYAWNNRQKLTYRDFMKSKEYAACIKQFPTLDKILEYNAIDIVNSVKNFKHNYIIHEGKIGYVLPEGISFKANYGWKTTFAYFFEVGKQTIQVRPQNYASLSILCCQLSYAELPKEFHCIMGVTGTLDVLPKCQKEVLKDWYEIKKLYSIPSVYGKTKREKLGAQVVPSEAHFTEICKAIAKAQAKQNRPVIVFFNTLDEVNEFYLSPEFAALKENAITLTERNDADAIKSRIIRATRGKNITIMTKTYGRGIDFVVSEKEVKESGGLHIIQTFISEQESEQKQIEGRTGRQGGTGSYELIIDEDELKKIQLSSSKLVMKSAMKIEEEINLSRNIMFQKVYEEQIQQAKKCRSDNDIAKKIIQDIRSNKNPRVREAVQALNKLELPFAGSGQTVKTVIGIDATGSMSSALSQVLHNTKQCLRRVIDIMKEKGVSSAFEIQMAIYRNYNLPADKLFEWSPFSNNANDLIRFLSGIKTEGGLGNEAIENLYNHVLKYETNVDQVIVIGDAAGNTNSEIQRKRKSNKGEAYWKGYPKYAEILNGEQLIEEMAKKNIPVHSLYIGAGPATYFNRVSKLTKGQSREFQYQKPKAADQLTAFIVENILNKIGGEKRGEELVTAYRKRFSS